ncbi:MAG: SRPBCC family protein [Acidimicrobiia bacterium]|nr:SRPBCC family protein [Acidimicrobiia bacterium]MDH4364422.1 SRPBCC family protein [Acidimicrobiia bacterium]
MSDDNSPVMEISESIRIEAPPAKVWALVTAMDRYGERSSENTGGYWRKGAHGEPGTGHRGDMDAWADSNRESLAATLRGMKATAEAV